MGSGIVLGSARGGGPIIAARLLAQRWQSMLGQVVENRVGANGGLATETVARAGDGHRLLFGTAGNSAIDPALFPNAAYDALHDFAPVGLLSRNACFLAVARRWAEAGLPGLIAQARLRPATPTVGSPGIGGDSMRVRATRATSCWTWTKRQNSWTTSIR